MTIKLCKCYNCQELYKASEVGQDCPICGDSLVEVDGCVLCEEKERCGISSYCQDCGALIISDWQRFVSDHIGPSQDYLDADDTLKDFICR